MKINGGGSHRLCTTRAASPVAAQPERGLQPVDTITIDYGVAREIGTAAYAATIPFIGAISRPGSYLSACHKGDIEMGHVSLIAGLSNYVGSGMILAGLVNGSGMAVAIGCGILGSCGLAAGSIAYAMTKDYNEWVSSRDHQRMELSGPCSSPPGRTAE